MKWKKRARLIAQSAAQLERWRCPFPDLSLDRTPAPTSDRVDYFPIPRKDRPKPDGLIVDHLHKSSLQVLSKSELPWAGGKKP